MTDTFHGATGSSPPAYEPPAESFQYWYSINEMRKHSHLITEREFRQILSRADRVQGPELLFDYLAEGRISDETVTAVAGGVWSDAEYPQSMSDFSWRLIFSHTTDFTVDGVPTPLPTEPIRLYRGCEPSRRRGFAWTSDIEVARRFAAGGLRGRRPGMLYRVDAPPSALRFHITDRDEAEYVIDPKGLRITTLPC